VIDFKEIFNAWIIASNPTKEQLQQADDRLGICKGDDTNPKCENYSELFEKKKWSAYCKGCGCPLDKKIFSEKINPCPLDKWDEIDRIYNTYIGMKHKKTLL
jgi:hypothetical protein